MSCNGDLLFAVIDFSNRSDYASTSENIYYTSCRFTRIARNCFTTNRRTRLNAKIAYRMFTLK